MDKQAASYCSYYQANVYPPKAWFLVAALRSFEHVAFDRTLDKETSLFEFFVPESTECYFLKLMDYFIDNAIVTNLTKKTNRLFG